MVILLTMKREGTLNGGLVALLVLVALLHLAAGSTIWIAPWQLFAEDHVTIGHLRLPRVLSCVVGGMTLGVTGAIFQAVFRNPIAEPYLLGVSGGAALGGSIAAITGVFGLLGGIVGPGLAMLAGLATLPLVLAMAGRGEFATERLLVGGVVIGSLLAALNTVVILMTKSDANHVLRWLLGSAANTNYGQVALIAGLLIVGAVLMRPRMAGLHLLMVSAESAKSLGVNPKRLVRDLLWIGTALSAAVVGIMGLIGFIGLVTPHIARLLCGQMPRKSFVPAALVGGILLVGADVVSQRLGELPVGAVTALVGAPALLWLLKTA